MPQNSYNLSVDIHSSAEDARKAIADVLELLGRLPKSVDIPVRITAPTAAPTLPQGNTPTLPRGNAPASAATRPASAPSASDASAVTAAIGRSAAAAIAAIRRTGEEAARSVASIIRAAVSSANAGRTAPQSTGVPAPTLPQGNAPTISTPTPSGTDAGSSSSGGMFSKILSLAKGVAGKAASVFKAAYGAVSGVVSKALGAVANAASKVFGKVVAIGAKAFAALGTAAKVMGVVGGAALSAIGVIAGIAASAVVKVFKAAFAVVKGVFGAIAGVVKGAFSVVAGIVKGAVGVIMLPFKALFAGIEHLSHVTVVAFGAVKTVAGVVKSAVAAIQPAAEFEQYRMQLKVLLKDTDKANDRFRKLKDYARDTNFNPDEVVKAGAAMQAFGLWTSDGMRRLRLAGDAANSFGMSLEDVVRSLNYLATGRGGEAMESLGRMGITRAKLKPFGVNFKKSGEMTTSPMKAVKAVFSYIEKNYGGMTQQMGSTWGGAVAQMGGALKDALADALSGTLPHMTSLVSDITKAISKTGSMLKNLNLEQYFAGPIAAIKGLVGILADLADPDLRDQGIAEIQGLWDGLKLTLSTAWQGLGKIGGSLLDALGIILEGAWDSLAASWRKMQSNGAWSSIFSSIGSILASVFKGGAELFRGLLDTYLPKFISDLSFLWDTIAEKTPLLKNSVTGEKKRRDEATEALKETIFKEKKDAGQLKLLYDRVREHAAKNKKPEFKHNEHSNYSFTKTEREWTEKEIDEVAKKHFWSSVEGDRLLHEDKFVKRLNDRLGFNSASSSARAEGHFEEAAKEGRNIAQRFSSIRTELSQNTDFSHLKKASGSAKGVVRTAASEAMGELSATVSQSIIDPLKHKGSRGMARQLTEKRRELMKFDAGHAEEIKGLQTVAYGGINPRTGRPNYYFQGKKEDNARKRLADIAKERKAITDEMAKLSRMSKSAYDGSGSLLTKDDYKAAAGARANAVKGFVSAHQKEYDDLYAKGWKTEGGRTVKAKGREASDARKALKSLDERKEAAGRSAYDASLYRSQIDASKKAHEERKSRDDIQKEAAQGQTEAARAEHQDGQKNPLLGPAMETADNSARTSDNVGRILKKTNGIETKMSRLIDILSADIPATATA